VNDNNQGIGKQITGWSVRRVVTLVGGLAAFAGLLLLLAGVQAYLSPAQGEEGRALMQPGVTPDLQLAQSLAEKEVIAARYAAALDAGRRSPGSRFVIQAAPDLPFLDNPPFQTGILTGEPGPFSAEQIFVENLWQSASDRGFVQVFAGALGNDLSQGVIVVLTTDSARAEGSEEWILTPTSAGAVRIVNAENNFLTLHSSSGARFLFDVENRILMVSE
jgi:hypothetical protein